MKYTSLLTLLLLFGCGGPATPEEQLIVENPRVGAWQNSETSPVRFELEQTFGAVEEPLEAMLSVIGSVVVDDAGNVYIMDWIAGSIKSFDANGAFRWTAGTRGEGPEEFNNSGALMWDGLSTLYVTDQSSTQLKSLNLSGEFLESVKTESIGFDRMGGIGFVAPNLLVVTTGLQGAYGARIHTLDLSDSFKEVGNFEVDQSDEITRENNIAAALTVSVMEDRIVVPNIHRYEWVHYSAQGDTLQIVRRDVSEFVRPSIVTSGGQSWGLRRNSILSTPITNQDGYSIAGALWPVGLRKLDYDEGDQDAMPTGSHRSLDLFDTDWRLLYSIEGEELTAIGFNALGFKASDNEGRMYIQLPDGSGLGRYRMMVEEPEL